MAIEKHVFEKVICFLKMHILKRQTAILNLRNLGLFLKKIRIRHYEMKIKIQRTPAENDFFSKGTLI